MSYKFTQLHKDVSLQRIQKEIEDNFPSQSDLNAKMAKTLLFVTTAPELAGMTEGQEIAYNDGTNKWLYRRIGGELYKYQLTKVT